MIIQPVVLCGGSGTRLWPLSREQYPKQLLRLCGDLTMLQATAMRLQSVSLGQGDSLQPPILVGNEDYRFLIAQQLQEVGINYAPLILEPCGRNTAPALTLAAHLAIEGGNDPILVVMPADHLIQEPAAFLDAVSAALEIANDEKLVIFGVRPTAPETGYGYIRADVQLSNGKGFKVAEFVEKPNRETAEKYLSDGSFLWNAGIFVTRASVWLSKIAGCRGDIANAMASAYAGAQHDRDFIRPDRAAFEASPSDSIDCAVMERLASRSANTGDVAIVPLEARWSDLGAWNALWEIGNKDARGNVLMGDVVAVESDCTLAIAESRLVACVGLRDAVVVETADAVLVAGRDRIQDVKQLVNHLKETRRSESHIHRKVHRPWGWYDSISIGTRFQVKRIVVNPGASISLQMHLHRAEHWVVVSGSARVTRGEEVLEIGENESTFIPLGTKHRLENAGNLPLEIIEVQSGSYLGEDDIVRFEDQYGRI